MDQQPQLAVEHDSFDLIVLTAMAVVVAVVLDLGPPQLVVLGQAVAVDLEVLVVAAVDLEVLVVAAVLVVAVDLLDREDYSV